MNEFLRQNFMETFALIALIVFLFIATSSNKKQKEASIRKLNPDEAEQRKREILACYAGWEKIDGRWVKVTKSNQDYPFYSLPNYFHDRLALYSLVETLSPDLHAEYRDLVAKTNRTSVKDRTEILGQVLGLWDAHNIFD